ncbi:MAG: hypothetical protein QOI48_1625 [Solirubrobacteraceae bacterium]|nr:hypothetical protein [Solirubrobacteraceae bacterium]
MVLIAALNPAWLVKRRAQESVTLRALRVTDPRGHRLLIGHRSDATAGRARPAGAATRLHERGRLRVLQRRRRPTRPVGTPQALPRCRRQCRAPAAPIPRPAPHRRHPPHPRARSRHGQGCVGHADLKTTVRYLHAVRASRLADAATRAFTPQEATEPAEADDTELRAAIRPGGTATVAGQRLVGRDKVAARAEHAVSSQLQAPRAPGRPGPTALESSNRDTLAWAPEPGLQRAQRRP